MSKKVFFVTVVTDSQWDTRCGHATGVYDSESAALEALNKGAKEYYEDFEGEDNDGNAYNPNERRSEYLFESDNPYRRVSICVDKVPFGEEA